MMFAPHRREQILQLLHQHKQVIVKDLARQLKVSEGTLRADLRQMEEEGLLERTHGGAVPVRSKKPSFQDLRVTYRTELNTELKQAIGRKAAELVHQGQCILLDASSTVLELAKALVECDYLTVVTNGVEAALTLNRNPRINVILIGGVLRPGSGSVEGVLGRTILEEIHADLFFTSSLGFTLEEGMTDFSLYEAELKKLMAANASRIVALLDHTKLDRRSIATSVQTRAVHTIITDDGADPAFLRRISGIEIHIADSSAEHRHWTE